jgi:hypothetical protein
VWLFHSQVWVHLARLTGIVKRSPHIAQRSAWSSLCAATSGHAAGSSSSSSTPSNMTGASAAGCVNGGEEETLKIVFPKLLII